jgi:hypothetical protein
MDAPLSRNNPNSLKMSVLTSPRQLIPGAGLYLVYNVRFDAQSLPPSSPDGCSPGPLISPALRPSDKRFSKDEIVDTDV